MYEFTQDCLTGIDQIDEEHRKLFSLINEAVELPKEARTPQTVKNILEHLSDYAVNHFAHEEAYMEAQNDPELPLQKKEHQAFADHVKLLEKQPLTGENASAMLDEILTYLVRWLYRHILSSDMMIGKMQKEDPFVFTAKYYTGIELVDREHRKLFEIIGEVNALIHNDLLHDKYDEIVRLLDELREYTKFHFEDEEAYMQKINSPMLEAQKRTHQAFVDKLMSIDLDKLEELCYYIKDNALCGLGQTAPNPVLSTLRYFRDEYMAHVVDKKCPAGVCKNLLTYKIDPDKCRGCTLCARNCPAGAIGGRVKEAHYINPDKCLKCGACIEKCRFDAIYIE